MANEPAQEHASQELILEINFVPTWARKPAGENPYAHMEGGGEREDRRRGRHDDRDRRGPRPPRGGGRPEGRERRGGPGARGRGGREAGAREHGRREHGPREIEPAREPAYLPIDVSFIPEKLRLGAVVRQIHAGAKAYPLWEVASLFLTNPEHYLVKLEVRGHGPRKAAPGEREPAREGAALCQCKVCKGVFLDEAAVIAHAVRVHVGDFYDVETVQVDPPAGNFVCVGRCRLSRVLIGPPNYHGFNEKVQELHRTRFSHMPLEEYRKQIETVRDPALVEKWKDEYRTRQVFRPKGSDPALPSMTWQEAEAHFLREHAPAMVQRAARVLLPAGIARQMPDGPLRRLMGAAWSRETQHPFSLLLALRPAFRHMRLHVFSAMGGSAHGGKATRGATFVTPIPPRPIDPEHTIATIREVLQFLMKHPGCTRQKMVESLRPGAAPDSSEVAAVLNPLRWLIEKGHVIEFFNGTLSVPTSGSPARRA